MRTWLVILVVAWAGLAGGQTVSPWDQADFLPGRAIVQFQPGVKLTVTPHQTIRGGNPALNKLFADLGAYAARRLVPDGTLERLKAAPDFYDVYVIRFDRQQPVLAALAALLADPLIVRAEPDLLHRAFRIPNDPMWSQQWDKRIVGADQVWDVSVGSRDIICAGIDTGVDWNHPDLTPNLWVNPGEDLDGDSAAWTYDFYPGDFDDLNGSDDDNNGYQDDFLGWDFIADISNCAANEDCDDNPDNDMFGQNSHGTHVGGIMVAAGNNGIGVAGMSWVGRLMSLRAGYLANDGEGYMPASATNPAILYAAANGANILNMSYGGPGPSGFAQDAINAAWTQGCILFAASGNDGSTQEQYPANFDNVIAVNATNNQDRLASWSNRGLWTDLCAPGANPGIPSTINNGYASWQGTSMASPNAAGVAALVWALFPDMSNAQLRDLLFDTATDIAPANPGITPSHLGHGRVDARAAVASAYPQLRVTAFTLNDAAAGDGDGRLESGESAVLTLTITNQVGWADGRDISLRVQSADPHLSVANGSFFLGNIASGQTINTQSHPITITAANLDTAYTGGLRVTFSSPAGYSDTRLLEFRVGRGRILIVDDDNGQPYEQYYVASATAAGFASDIWSVQNDGAALGSELAQYEAVIWSCGNEQTATLTVADRATLEGFLNGGGNLILIGQNIDEDLRGTAFYADYLHVQSAAAAGGNSLNGVAGDPVSDGMSLLLRGGGCAGNGEISPSQIVPLGDAVAMFNYAASGAGAVRYSGAYKTAYFAFALEAACGLGASNRYDAVIAAVLNWMNVLDADAPAAPVLPTAIRLRGNYPNPFNATTTIAFELPAPLRVNLTVYDILGRHTATLLNGIRGAGVHHIAFDGSQLASGVYIVRLAAGQTVHSTKIVLIK